MVENQRPEGMLSPYRALDLADEKGFFCSKVLGDLGVDVIKIERPGGDPARNIGPFYHDEPHPEKSLFWFAFNSSKRGITLDIETADGRGIFKRLVKTADFVIESFNPGHMDKLGLGYSALEKINAGVIMVSITPFGQCGPYKDYKAPDIVAWAMGGAMYPWGDADRTPIRISYHSHAYLLASLDGALGALFALHHRNFAGEGQYVDVSIQESVLRCPYLAIPWWDLEKKLLQRGEQTNPNLRIPLPRVWSCKDGEVMWVFRGGVRAPDLNGPLIKWMDREGMSNDFLNNFDWEKFDLMNTTQEIIDQIAEPTAKFFMTHTKAEILREALLGRVDAAPSLTTKDLMEYPQLEAREFFVKLEHPELGTSVRYPGALAETTEATPRPSRRAPLIGEHNLEIYERELGFSREELVMLKQARVI